MPSPFKHGLLLGKSMTPDAFTKFFHSCTYILSKRLERISSNINTRSSENVGYVLILQDVLQNCGFILFNNLWFIQIYHQILQHCCCFAILVSLFVGVTCRISSFEGDVEVCYPLLHKKSGKKLKYKGRYSISPKKYFFLF